MNDMAYLIIERYMVYLEDHKFQILQNNILLIDLTYG